jgi:hypothetical protein
MHRRRSSPKALNRAALQQSLHQRIVLRYQRLPPMQMLLRHLQVEMPPEVGLDYRSVAKDLL